jgi:hypothetical protein
MKKYIFFVLFFWSFFGCSSADNAARNAVETGNKFNPVRQVYFTKHNIWYKDPVAIKSTNYIDGTFIPLGTKVNITDLTNEEIKFTTVSKNRAYVIIYVRKHTPMSMQELFARYFVADDPLSQGTDFYNSTSKEQDQIKKGKIVVGMSKKAVVMALGYPPSHKTPDLEGDVWSYWGKRVIFCVYFTDDKVSGTDKEVRFSPFEARQRIISESGESLTE